MDGVHNLRPAVSSSKWIRYASRPDRPRFFSRAIVKRFRKRFARGSREPGGSTSHGFWSFRIPSQNEQRFPQGWHLFLNTARVGNDEPCVGHEVHEIRISHGPNHMDARMVVQEVRRCR